MPPRSQSLYVIKIRNIVFVCRVIWKREHFVIRHFSQATVLAFFLLPPTPFFLVGEAISCLFQYCRGWARLLMNPLFPVSSTSTRHGRHLRPPLIEERILRIFYCLSRHRLIRNIVRRKTFLLLSLHLIY